MRDLRATYDSVADASYIYLVPHTGPGLVSSSAVLELDASMSAVIVDLDVHGRIVGIEMLDVSSLVSPKRLGSESLVGACLSYDAAADVARVDLDPAVEPASVRDVALIDTEAHLRVGFDAAGTIVRFEFPDASSILPTSVMTDVDCASGC